MGLQKIESKKYTFEEYLQLEEKATFKSEFWDGEIIAMAGSSPNHSKIANSIGTAIDNALDKKGKDCTVYNSDLKVYIPKFNKSVYPDNMVLCTEEAFHKNSKAIITNPSLIIEVLSASTHEYDKGSKFEGYRSLSSFKEYVLIWQTIPKIQSWYKESNDLWRISSAFGLDKTIHLYALDITIELKDVYKRVKNLGVDETSNY